MLKERTREKDVLDSLATATGTITMCRNSSNTTRSRRHPVVFVPPPSTLVTPFPPMVNTERCGVCCMHLNISAYACTPAMRYSTHAHHLSSVDPLRCYVWCCVSSSSARVPPAPFGHSLPINVICEVDFPSSLSTHDLSQAIYRLLYQPARGEWGLDIPSLTLVPFSHMTFHPRKCPVYMNVHQHPWL